MTLLDDPGPVAYFSLPQVYSRSGNALLLKVRGDPVVAVDEMERELNAVGTRLAIVNILPYRDVVRGFLYTQRMNAELFSVIAALRLLLAATGVFAVVALAVASGRREIGNPGGHRSRPDLHRNVSARSHWSVPAFGPGCRTRRSIGGNAPGGEHAPGKTTADPLALAIWIGVLLMAVVLSLALPLRRALNFDPIDSLGVE